MREKYMYPSQNPKGVFECRAVRNCTVGISLPIFNDVLQLYYPRSRNRI